MSSIHRMSLKYPAAYNTRSHAPLITFSRGNGYEATSLVKLLRRSHQARMDLLDSYIIDENMFNRIDATSSYYDMYYKFLRSCGVEIRTTAGHKGHCNNYPAEAEMISSVDCAPPSECISA